MWSKGSTETECEIGLDVRIGCMTPGGTGSSTMLLGGGKRVSELSPAGMFSIDSESSSLSSGLVSVRNWPSRAQAHYSAFRLGKKMASARNGNIYTEFYSSNNNVRRFLHLFSVLMLFIETNYKTGPCVIHRSLKMILKKVHFFSKRRFGDV